MTMPSTPPTPPATQVPPFAGDIAMDVGASGGVVRHSQFYEESENLRDGVVLRVSSPLVVCVCLLRWH